MKERRREKRKHTIYYIRVLDKETGKLTGRLVDIATNGLKMFSEKPIETNTIFQFSMDLPITIEGGKKVSFEAESKWCDLNKNSDFFDSGFQIINASKKDIRAIEHLCEDVLACD